MSVLSLVVILLEAALAAAYFIWAQGDGSGFTFASPWVLLLLIPLASIAVLELAGKRSPMFNFSYTVFTGGLPETLPQLLRPAVIFLGFLAVAFVIIAAARPQTDSASDKDYAEGIDIVFALDVSGSMEAADFKPSNRLEVAKDVLSEVIQKRKSDRIGLVVFAGEAYTQVPLTLDYNVLVNLLQDIRTRVIKDGTAIGDALGTSINRLRDEQSKTRVVILLTDGDNNAGSLPPLEAASMAADLGVVVYTILIGRDGPVPFPAGVDLFGKTVYNEVKVPINPALMDDIAKKTGGLSFRAEDRESLRRTLIDTLNHLEKTRFEDTTTTQKHELFVRYLVLGLLFLLLERALRLTRFEEALE